jgi:hypothetical protein
MALRFNPASIWEQWERRGASEIINQGRLTSIGLIGFEFRFRSSPHNIGRRRMVRCLRPQPSCAQYYGAFCAVRCIPPSRKGTNSFSLKQIQLSVFGRRVGKADTKADEAHGSAGARKCFIEQ